MNSVDEILDEAKKRGRQVDLSYSGLLSPEEVYAVLQHSEDIKLVDVRSNAELDLVGRVPGAIHIEWAFYPGMVANPDFAKQLESQVEKDDVVIFMCRTGGRSHNAAIAAAAIGYNDAFNMLQGFEGDANEQKQRTLINGWKHAGLPWSN